MIDKKASNIESESFENINKPSMGISKANEIEHKPGDKADWYIQWRENNL